MAKHSRTRDGRFVVPLPQKSNIDPIRVSRELAVCRFFSLERSKGSGFYNCTVLGRDQHLARSQKRTRHVVRSGHDPSLMAELDANWTLGSDPSRLGLSLD